MIRSSYFEVRYSCPLIPDPRFLIPVILFIDLGIENIYKS